jgi:uncharacterized protein (DUF2141 family)
MKADMKHMHSNGLGLLAALILAAAPARAAELIVEITGLNTGEGKVVMELFGSRAGFPRQSSYRLEADIVEGTARAEFKDLGPSDYVVHAWHDINGDGELDRGFGAEPFGFSNGLRDRRPSWEEARVSLGIDPLVVRIDLAGD